MPMAVMRTLVIFVFASLLLALPAPADPTALPQADESELSARDHLVYAAPTTREDGTGRSRHDPMSIATSLQSAQDDPGTYEIVLLPGEYPALQLADQSGLTIRGLTPGSVTVVASAETAVEIRQSSDVTLNGLRIERPVVGVRISDSADIQIRGARIFGAEEAIVVDASQSIQILQSSISSHGPGSVAVRGSAGSDILMRRNVIQRTGARGTEGKRLVSTGASRSLITENIVLDSSNGPAIQVRNGQAVTANVAASSGPNAILATRGSPNRNVLVNSSPVDLENLGPAILDLPAFETGLMSSGVPTAATNRLFDLLSNPSIPLEDVLESLDLAERIPEQPDQQPSPRVGEADDVARIVALIEEVLRRRPPLDSATSGNRDALEAIQRVIDEYSSSTSGASVDVPVTPSESLLVIGDIGDCNSDAPAQVAALVETLPGSIVAVGDIAYPNGTLDELQRCFGQPFKNVLDRIIPVTGNHEYGTPNAQGWKDFFGRTDTYYTKQLTPEWLLIVVDTECEHVGGCGPNDPQQTWLKDVLTSAPKCVVLASHRPFRTSYDPYDFESRVQHIQTIAEANNVDVILNSHAHMYEHIDLGTSQQFTVGTGGAGLRPADQSVPGSSALVIEHGALQLNLNPTNYNWKFHTTNQTTPHTGTQNCT